MGFSHMIYQLWKCVDKGYFLTLLEALRMSLTCSAQCFSPEWSVRCICRSNTIPALGSEIWHCLLHTVKTGTLVIMLDHLWNVFDLVFRSICLLYITNIWPFRTSCGVIVARTNSLNWLLYLVHMMHYLISEMFHPLLDGFLELLKTEYLAPSF